MMPNDIIVFLDSLFLAWIDDRSLVAKRDLLIVSSLRKIVEQPWVL